MTLRSLRRVLADSRGQSLVEFSLSALMLVLVMFGVFEMSRMLLVYTTVANAARAGARYAIVHGAHSNSPATLLTTQTVVKNYLTAAPVNTSIAVITTGGTGGPGGAVGSTVSVNVTYPYDPWVGFYTHLFSINISSTSEGVITW
jgi:Flp pilus assembly protein TadG